MIYVPTDDSFVSCLRSAFPNAIRDAEHSLLFKSVYFFNFENKGISCEVKFLINSVVNTYYLDVIVSGKSRTQIVKALEQIQTTIENFLSSKTTLKSSLMMLFPNTIAIKFIQN